MLVPINNVAQFGIVADVLPHELPLNAWSAGQNIRFKDNYAEKFSGHQAAFGTPSVAPYWLLPVATPTNYFWLYAGLAKVYSVVGVTHTDITRTVGGDYAATADLNWTGQVLNGVPIINNGVDVPQMWLPAQAGTPLANLTNWPAGVTCRALRAFKTFLLALDVTEAGTRYPTVLRWSHPADPGAVPTTWDYTDTTADAGRVPIAQTGDFLIDSVPLRDNNVLYKENTTVGMQFLPGNSDIFRFFTMFNTFGAISRRCIVEAFFGSHLVFTGDDLVKHDGQVANSVLDSRMRKWLQNQLDATNYGRSFVTVNYPKYEVWLCFVVTGQSFPTQAIVWNWKSNTIGVRDLDLTAHIEPGIITNAGTSDVWDNDADPWDIDSTVWDSRNYKPNLREMLKARPSTAGLFQMDSTEQFAGTDMTSYLERTGIGIPFREKDPPDFGVRKFMKAVWPRIEGTDGGVVQVYIGVQEVIDGPVTYQAPQDYTIGTTKKIDCRISGRLFALKFRSTTNISWRLHGYDMDVNFMGRH